MAYIGKIKDRNGDVVYPQTMLAAIPDYEPMRWTQETKEGIAYLNASYDHWTNATHYRTLEFPNMRLVLLSVHLKSGIKIDSANNHTLSLISIPSNIRPLYGTSVVQAATGGDGAYATFYLGVGTDGIVNVTLPNNMTGEPGSMGYHAEFFYASLKN